MKKSKLIILILIVVIIVGIIISFIYSNPNKSSDTELSNLSDTFSQKEMNLYFYDNKTNCTLNGEVYLNNNLIGNNKNGVFILTKKTYEKYTSINSTLMLKGTTDYCFGNDENILFLRGWDVSDLNNNFDLYYEYLLIADLTPRQPLYHEEMSGFVRTEEVMGELKNMNLNLNKTQREIIDDIFARFYLGYLDDSVLFKQFEYWQTPSETVKNKGGDCEDWAIRFISLLRAYNSSLNCYVAIWDTHANVLCRIDNFFKIYDQDKITSATSIKENPTDEFIINQENNVGLRGFINNYFNKYGVSSNERRIYVLFNDKEIIEFDKTEEFINWCSNFSKF